MRPRTELGGRWEWTGSRTSTKALTLKTVPALYAEQGETTTATETTNATETTTETTTTATIETETTIQQAGARQQLVAWRHALPAPHRRSGPDPDPSSPCWMT